MSASYYLTAMFNNCVPQRQLRSCNVTRPFLSLRRVWLVRLDMKLVGGISVFGGNLVKDLIKAPLKIIMIHKGVQHACESWGGKPIGAMKVKVDVGLLRQEPRLRHVWSEKNYFGAMGACCLERHLRIRVQLTPFQLELQRAKLQQAEVKV